MENITVEMFSSKLLKTGDILEGFLIKDMMYEKSSSAVDKYLIQLRDRDLVSCGYISRESVFAKYTSRDIIKSVYDLKKDLNKTIQFKVVEIKTIEKNKRTVIILEMLDIDICSNILGISASDNAKNMVDKYLDDSIINKMEEKISEFKQKEVLLNVKGDAKTNPKKTTVAKLVKNSKEPTIELVLDDKNRLRTLYEGEYAGEVLNIPSDFKIENISSIQCISSIPLGYSILIKYCRTEIDEKKSKDNTYSKLREVEFNEEKLENKNSLKKSFKADKKEVSIIVNYLINAQIPETLISKVIGSYEPFEDKYLERIPHSSDESFTPWIYSEDEKNLLLLAIIQIEEGFNLRFVGSAGTGKNTLLHTLCWVYQRPYFTQSASVDIDTSVLIGEKDLDHKVINGTVVQDISFEIGQVVEAMEVGGIFELGEGNSCRPGVLTSMHSILDNRRFIDIKGYRLVQAHPRFSFVLTMNVDYEGCNDLNAGFRDRFATIKFSPQKDITKILSETCSFSNEKDINICNRVYKDLLALSSELQGDEIVTIRGYIRALQMSKYIPIKEALECCITNNISDDEFITNRIKQIIQNITG